MKKYIVLFMLALIVGTSCKKSELQINNPSSPTPDVALATQVGLEEYALGIWTKTYVGNNLLMHALVIHSIMGDEEWASVGNFGWRYANQVSTITLPAPYSNVVLPNPFGVTQAVQLKSLNTLVSAQANATDVIVYEWNLCYFMNGEANNLLKAIAANKVVSAAEKNVLTAWAYWWKGLAYSRLGSMYTSGVINNNTDGTTSPNYIGHDALVAEGNANFDKAAALLAPLANTDATFVATMKVINPSFVLYPTTPAMWVREIYTYEARNLMVNKKVAAMTATDWTNIKTLAAKGMVSGDQGFAEGLDPAVADLAITTQQHVFLWNDYIGNPAWVFLSERLVQDFKPGDIRFTKGVVDITGNAAVFFTNKDGRGYQFGTRWAPNLIENGGYWSTNTQRKGYSAFAGTYEENALMLAEANIRTPGGIEAGLPYIDAVRTLQGAGLAAVTGTGLTLPQAIEELRKERRIGLFLRGLAFYDARRWGVTAPVSAGGGRADGVVLVPKSAYLAANSSGYTPMNCIIDYNYMDYFDVPVTEFSYNTPASGSAPIVAN